MQYGIRRTTWPIFPLHPQLELMAASALNRNSLWISSEWTRAKKKITVDSPVWRIVYTKNKEVGMCSVQNWGVFENHRLHC